ncbi:hypothetical protein EDD21DRAFT_371454 [Dissophora ornata]|nr:hypothetical protein EDD21DRAFT_371454 [Dissophora ornata]
MTSSSSPFKALFKSSSTPNDNASYVTTSSHDTRTKPKLKVTKPTNTSTTTTTKSTSVWASSSSSGSGSGSGSADQNIKKRSAFFSLLPTSSSSSPSTVANTSATSSSSMLSLPTALFPSPHSSTGSGPASGAGARRSKLKHGLFNKAKRPSKSALSDSEQQQQAAEERNTGWSSRPWAGWGASLSPSNGFQSDSSNSEETPTSKARQGWISIPKASKSDTDVAVVAIEQQEHRENYFKSKKKTKSAPDDGGDKGSGQIMLHPAYNLSSQSVLSSSSPPNDQSLPSAAYQQQYHQCSSQEQICVHHQQLQQQQQRPSRMGVTLVVHDVFGIGKVTEMSLALFLAHDAFLSRRPFWLQCAILAWEALVVLLVIWGVLRVVGLAEVVIWGADDLVRGTVSMIQALGHAVRFLVVR